MKNSRFIGKKQAFRRISVKALLFVTLLLTATTEASAQQQMIPVYGKTGDMGCVMVVDSIRLSRATVSSGTQGYAAASSGTQGSETVVGLTLQLNLAGTPLQKTDKVTLVPRLFTATDSVDFPAVHLYARWAYINLLRSGAISPISPISPMSPIGPLDLHLQASEARTPLSYSQHTAYQPWMEQAQLKLVVSETDGCGTEHQANSAIIGETRMVLNQHTERIQERSTTQQLSGRAYISFMVNKTDILPEYRRNRRELAKLHSVLDSLRNVENMDIRRLTLKGFASPEGSYSHNEELARGRVESLRDYIVTSFGLNPDIISTAYEPEDWVGLRDYVVHSQLAERDKILAIIDGNALPDDKLSQIASGFPAAYKQLSAEAFPQLRHTDYSIDYSVTRGVDRDEVKVLIDTSYVHTLVLHQEPLMPAVGLPLSTYRPWIAVKTNLLYDLLVAPNIELELPLGRKARWSLMAEYTNPWWRWDRLSQSYEIQEGGLELRHWFSPRCAYGRPCLTGHFWGLYGAVAKYDLEHNEVGDQGEIVSGGLTYGYAWPLSKHWNLELSASAGVIFGERRHYNAEFESTHLIYKYTKNMFYAGPTKLKVSLVWLLGKKGGVL